MFAIGGLPALLVTWIRRSVHEPSRWKPAQSPFALIFSKEYRRRTILNAIYLFVSITGLWAGSVYVPSAVAYLATQSGLKGAEVTRMSSLATVILSVGTILGCVALPPLAERWGRRWTLAFFFSLMFCSISLGFGFAYYLASGALTWFLVSLALLGFGGANFTMYSLWLPEQYRTECRASAFGFATSAGRFLGAGITLYIGWLISQWNTIGLPVAMTSVAFLLGILLLPFGVESDRLPD